MISCVHLLFHINIHTTGWTAFPVVVKQNGQRTTLKIDVWDRSNLFHVQRSCLEWYVVYSSLSFLIVSRIVYLQDVKLVLGFYFARIRSWVDTKCTYTLLQNHIVNYSRGNKGRNWSRKMKSNKTSYPNICPSSQFIKIMKWKLIRDNNSYY